jgi:hypothetical protein
MIIVVINDICITIYEFEEDSPVAGHSDRMLIFQISSKLMQICPREIHIFDVIGAISSIQYSFSFISMFRPDAFLIPCIKEVFKPFMFERFDHN